MSPGMADRKQMDVELVQRILDDVAVATMLARERLASEGVSQETLLKFMLTVLESLAVLGEVSGLEKYLRIQLFKGDAKWVQN